MRQIRDLEARVEILSGGKDEALGEMRNMLKGSLILWLFIPQVPIAHMILDLMTENQTLRNLLRSLGSFIGDGAGGLLPKLGWEMADFNNFINRSETDTAWEGYQQRKKQAAESGSSTSKKRAAEDDVTGTHTKKARSGENEGEQAFPLLISEDTPLPANGMYHRSSRTEGGGGMFADLLRSSGNSPMFIQQSATSATPPSYPESAVGSYPPSYIPSVSVNIDSPLPLPYNSTNATNTSAQQQADDEPLEDGDPNRNEAYKLIQ